jgi:hypothetical protein
VSREPLLDREQIENAFRLLGEKLARRGVVADIYVFGGAAMVLAYDARRATRDVDAVFQPHGMVLDEARGVADALGLPPWWLNEQASIYVSGKVDPGKRNVFDHPGLRVAAASPEHMLAMKVLSGRPRDADDIRLLLQHLDIATANEALAICGRVFPHEEVPNRSRLLLEDILSS